jgi:3-oxoacyl-[acyl-carrier protein] reductase
MEDCMSRAKPAIVTGASSGIGRAVATLLAADGYTVLMVARHEHLLASAVAEVTGAGSPRAEAAAVDVRDFDRLADRYERFARRYGSVRALVNCAGINIPSSLTRGTRHDWDEVIGVNLTGTYHSCKAFLPVAADPSAIVNVSSLQARKGGRSPQYAASKAGVEALTRVLARELAPAVRVNTVAPGPVETGMSATWDQHMRDALRDATLLGRIAEPGEVASAIHFLLGPGASFITGTTIGVDGGAFLD